MTHQYGPVEVQVVSFPGSQFNGSIAPALRKVVESGVINVVDLAFIAKTAEGEVGIIELSDAADNDLIALDEAMEEVLGLLNEEDLVAIGDSLAPGSSAVAIVIEHAWARELGVAVASSAGEVVLSERIPRDVVQAAVEAALAS